MENKFAFRAKKRQKIGFFGVFRAALKHFGIVLYDSDDAQTYKMAFQLDARGTPILKTATLLGEMRFEPKNFNKVGFLGSSGLH